MCGPKLLLFSAFLLLGIAPLQAVSVSADGGRISITVTAINGYASPTPASWAGCVIDFNRPQICNVQANTGPARSTSIGIYQGSISGAATWFAIDQAAGTSISPTSATPGASAGTGSITVTSASAWTSSTSTSWITITSGNSGSGNGSVGYSYTANSSITSRSGTITVAGKTFSVTQSGVTPVISLSPTSLTVGAAGNASQSISVTASPSDATWAVTSKPAWVTVVSGTSGTGSGVTVLSIASLSTVAGRSGTAIIGGQSLAITQTGVTGTLTLNSTSMTAAAGGDGGSLSFTSNASDFGWTATSSQSWASVSPASGTGSGSVSYTVAANTSINPRTATLTIGGQTFAITQSGVIGSLTLGSASATPAASGASGTITFVSTATDYAWTAASNQSWATVSPASGTGSGSVSYSVQTNSFTSTRTATVTIGDKSFTITQAGVPGSLTLSASSASVLAESSSGTVSFTSNTTDFGWTASSNQSWVTVSPASGTGSGSLSYSIAASTTIQPRTATLTIGDKTFTITQAGVVGALSLSASSAAAGSGTGTGSVSVICNAADYAWTASSNQSWLTISPASGTGSGTVSYSVAASSTINPRAAIITIGDKTFTVTQAGVTGSLTLSSSSASPATTGGSGTVTFTSNVTDYQWTASSDQTWVTITPTSGTAGGSISYTVEPHNRVASRSAAITIGDKTFTITQAGLIGSLTLASSSSTALANSGNSTVSFTSNAPDYAWTASSNQSWVTVSPTSGTGSGNISYTVAATTTVNSRTATLTIGDKTFTVTQDGAVGSLTLASPSASPVATASTGSLTFTSNATDYAWTASVDQSWVTVSPTAGSGSGSVSYSVAATTSVNPRTATLTIGNKTFTITQVAAVGTLTLATTSATPVADGGSGTVTFTSNATDYAWTSASSTSWLTVTPASGAGSGSVNYAVTPTNSVNPRTATLTIGDKTFTVMQAAVTGTLTLATSSATPAASAGTGTIAFTSNAIDYAWTASSSQNWVSLSPSSGTGSGSVNYSVTATTSVNPRSATITIGDKTFSLTQAGAVGSLTLASPSAEVPMEATSGSVTFTSTATDYQWTASSNQSWASVSPAQGTGSGAFSYTVTANPSVSPRTATVSIGDRSFTIVQSGKQGSLNLSSNTAEIPASGGGGTISITSNAADYTWTAVTAQNWVTLSPASGSGSGSISFQVSPTSSAHTRTAVLTIGNRTFTITQAGGQGFVTLSNALTITNTGGSRTVSVAANYSDYAWTAASSADWITLASGGGTGSGDLVLQIAEQRSIHPRSSSVTVDGHTLTVTQSGGTGMLVIGQDTLRIEAVGGIRSIPVTTNYTDHPWTAVSNSDWITIQSGGSGTGNGTIVLQVSPLEEIEPRTGTVTINDRTLSITQTNGVILSPAVLNLTGYFGGGSLQRTVGITSGSPGAPYQVTVQPVSPWLSVNKTSGQLPDSIQITVDPAGLALGTYSASITINDQTIPVSFAVTKPVVQLSQSSLFFQRTSAVVIAPQAVLISATGGPVTFTASVGPNTGGWLAVSSPVGSAPGAIQVHASTGGLQPGEYTGSVLITLMGAATESIVIPVTLRVPTLAVSVETIDGQPAAASTSENMGNGQIAFQSQAEAPTATRSATLAVNAENGIRQFTVDPDTNGTGNWLSVSPRGGTTPANLTVTVNRTGLAPGTYTGYININSNTQVALQSSKNVRSAKAGVLTAITDAFSASAASSQSVTIGVTFTVDVPDRSVTLSPASINVAQRSGTTSPRVFTVRVTGRDGSPFYAATNSEWLQVSPSSGTLPASVTVTVNPPNSAAAVTTGTIAFTTPDAPGAKLLPVQFLLQPNEPPVTATPDPIELTAEEGAAPVTGTVEVNLRDPGTFFAVASDSWLSVPAQAMRPGMVQITAMPGSLPAGNYYGWVRFTNSSGSTQVAVTLQVKPKPSLNLVGGPVVFRALQGGSDPAPNTVFLSSVTRGILFSINTGGADWLEVTPSRLTTPANLRISVAAAKAKLAPGTYTATIQVTAPDAPNSPFSIPVTLTVDRGVPALAAPVVVGIASRERGPIAPGMLIALTGIDLPVAEKQSASLQGGTAPTQLAGVRVLFDGYPAPVLQVSAGEVLAMVPYELTGRTETVLQLEHMGQTSPTVLVPVVPHRPEMVPIPGVSDSYARHPDGTPVTASAPAAPDSIITVAVTGLGQIEPTLASTAIQSVAVPIVFSTPVEIVIDGRPCEVLFAGPMPGQVPGLIQINIRIPDSTNGEGVLGVHMAQSK